MPYVFLHTFLPEVAELETRSITIMTSANEFGLPFGEYTFLELFCDECDCRKAMFYVVKNQGRSPVAVISWGWETKQFYEKWLGFNDVNMIKEMMGVCLNTMSPQSPIAKNVLEMFKTILFKDVKYLERVKRHYELIRQTIKKDKKRR